MLSFSSVDSQNGLAVSILAFPSLLNLFYYSKHNDYVQVVLHLSELDCLSHPLLTIVFYQKFESSILGLHSLLTPQSYGDVLSINDTIYYVFRGSRMAHGYKTVLSAGHLTGIHFVDLLSLVIL
jgi:hypothetical protein